MASRAVQRQQAGERGAGRAGGACTAARRVGAAVWRAEGPGGRRARGVRLQEERAWQRAGWARRRRAGGTAAVEQEERGGGPVCEQEEPMVGGTDEELPTRRDRCATRRSCTCTSDEADICYSAADSGCLCPVASRPVEAGGRTATTGRRWWRAPGRCSRAGTRSRQDPGGHRGGEEKKGWRRQMTCGAVCQ